MQKSIIKKLKYHITLLIVYILLLGCNSHLVRDEVEQYEFYTIDFKKSFETEQQMFISEIADTVEYLELKTPEDIVITRIWKVIHYGNYLIIHARWNTYLFNKDGQFICRIGNVGEGPGEYITTCDVGVDYRKKEILLADVRKIIRYDFEGKFLRYHLAYTENIAIGISDSILWTSNMIYSINTKYQATAYSLNNETEEPIAYIPNPAYTTEKSDNAGYVGVPFTNMFYYKNDFLFFKGEPSNDTIWKISGTNITPHAFINMGKYKLPFENEAWISMDNYWNSNDMYWGVPSLVEDDNYFFLFSLNRTSGKENPNLKYIVYDKKKGKGFAVNDNNGMGITDDIHRSIPIWPRWSSDEYYISAIEPHELLEQIESGDYSPSTQFNELLSRIGEDSNQLIVLCRKKK